MPATAIAQWFAAYHQRQVRRQRGMALLMMALGVLVLLVEWLVVVFFFSPLVLRHQLSGLALLLGAFMVVPITFLLAGRGEEAEMEAPDPVAAEALAKLAEKQPSTRAGRRRSRSVLSGYLLAGPRLLALGSDQWRTARRMAAVDAARVAPVIAVLYAEGRKVPFPELIHAVPGLEPSRDFPALELIDGVLFLHKEPAGLALGTALREDLQRQLGDARPGDARP